jgi:hypothetical protein
MAVSSGSGSGRNLTLQALADAKRLPSEANPDALLVTAKQAASMVGKSLRT